MNIHKYLMEKHNIVYMLRLNKQFFTELVLLLLRFGRSLTTKCVSLNNQPCIAITTLIDLIIYELHYYSFIESQGRCKASCNAVEDPFGIIWVPSKIEDNKDCKTGKHSKDCTFTMSIIDDLNDTCDEIIDTRQRLHWSILLTKQIIGLFLFFY